MRACEAPVEMTIVPRDPAIWLDDRAGEVPVHEIIKSERFWVCSAVPSRGRIDACLFDDGSAAVYDLDAGTFTAVPEGYAAARCKARAMAIVRGDGA